MLIKTGQAQGLGDGLGEQLDDIAEAAHSMRTLVRCADSGSPCRIGAAGAAVRAAVAMSGIGKGNYHEIVAVPPYRMAVVGSQSDAVRILLTLPPLAANCPVNTDAKIIPVPSSA